MEHEFSNLFLQKYWWVVLSLLTGVMVQMLYIFGGQILSHQVGKSKIEREMTISVLGHKWGLTIASIATWVAVVWAVFPLLYAVTFSGAYAVWTLILMSYVVTICAYEYRNKSAFMETGGGLYTKILSMCGLNASLLLGIMLSTFFTGNPYAIDVHPQSGLVQPQWMGIMGGLELFLDMSVYTSYINFSLGLAFVFLSVVMGALYFKYRIENEDVERRATKVVRNNMPFFILFFLFFIVNIWVRPGYEYSAEGYITLVPHKYLLNMYEMPLVGCMCIVGFILMMWGMIKGCRINDCNGFYYAAAGCISTIWGLMCSVGLNNTSFYPASGWWTQNSLTIENSSTGGYSMTVMFYISLLLPLVLGCVLYVWKTMDSRRINKDTASNHK